MPAACEFLDVTTPQYIADLVAWARAEGGVRNAGELGAWWPGALAAYGVRGTHNVRSRPNYLFLHDGYVDAAEFVLAMLNRIPSVIATVRRFFIVIVVGNRC